MHVSIFTHDFEMALYSSSMFHSWNFCTSIFQWIEKKTEVLKLKTACGEVDLSGSDSESSINEDEDKYM